MNRWVPINLWLLFLAMAPAAAAGMAGAAPRWDFVATIDPVRERLSLRGCADAAADEVRLRAGSGASAHLRQARRGGDVDLPMVDDMVRAQSWRAGECFLADIDLRSAGDADRFKLGRAAGQYYRLAPESWLWRPWRIDPDSRIRFELPPGWSVSVPWTPTGARGEHRLGATPPDWPAQTAFGRFGEREMDLPGGRLRVSVLPLVDATLQDSVHDWFRANASLLLCNDGTLPLPDTQILIVPLPGVNSPVPWGQVSRGGGAAVSLFVGAAAGRQRWQSDWTLAHELAHLQHPYLGERGRWLAEGMASYYQNVWRARRGEFSPSEAWRRLDAGFARGRAVGAGPALAELAAGRGGTMRVYWSGAAFWLESDLALRAQGSSLDAVLAEFRDAHLPSERAWRPGEFIAALDDEIPAAQLMSRYRRHAERRDFPDQREVYLSLGLVSGALPEGDFPPHRLRDAIMGRQAQSRGVMESARFQRRSESVR